MIAKIIDGKKHVFADVSVNPDWAIDDDNDKAFVKNKPHTSSISSYDENKEYKQGDIIFKEGGYYRLNDGIWELIIIPRLDINLEKIYSEEEEGTTTKILLQFDRDIDDFIDLKNVKLGGEVLADQVRFLGNGLYEVDIWRVTKDQDIDVYLKKNSTLDT